MIKISQKEIVFIWRLLQEFQACSTQVKSKLMNFGPNIPTGLRPLHAINTPRAQIKPTPPSFPNHNDLTINGVCKKFIHGKCKLSTDCPFSHDKSKIRPCNKFQSAGHCGYGQKCNFSHDLKICTDFNNSTCDKGEDCQYRHVFKSCPNFDLGFCFLGKNCPFKHIVRKLCWDYMYGYCEKGGRCNEYHPKIFVQEDFQGTKKLFQEMSKTDPQIYICNYCAQIGHKSNNCPKKKQISPQTVIKCGMCGTVHPLIDKCIC